MVDLATNDILFNFVTMTLQLCRKRDGKLEKGAKKKFEVLMKFFVHCLRLVGGITIDMVDFTGIVIYSIQLLFLKFFLVNLIYTLILMFS